MKLKTKFTFKVRVSYIFVLYTRQIQYKIFVQRNTKKGSLGTFFELILIKYKYTECQTTELQVVILTSVLNKIRFNMVTIK